MDESNRPSAERIEELGRSVALHFARWAERFKNVDVNDREDFLQIARLVCWKYRDKLRELESERHVVAYLKIAIKGAILFDAGIKQGKATRLRTRQFPTRINDKGNEESFEASIPSNEQDVAGAASERDFAQKNIQRLRAFLEEYKRDVKGAAREILETALTTESPSSIGKRLGCSKRYVNAVKERFIERARKKFKNEAAIAGRERINKFKGDSNGRDKESDTSGEGSEGARFFTGRS